MVARISLYLKDREGGGGEEEEDVLLRGPPSHPQSAGDLSLGSSEEHRVSSSLE